MAARGPDSFDIMFNSCMYILFVRGASVCQWGHGRHHGNVAASYTDSSAWLLWWSSTLDECQWPPMHTVGWFVVALWHVEQELYWFRCSCAQKWKSELPFLLWLGSLDVSVLEVYRFSFSSFAYFEQIVTAALAQEQPMLFFFFCSGNLTVQLICVQVPPQILKLPQHLFFFPCLGSDVPLSFPTYLSLRFDPIVTFTSLL